MSVFNQNNEFTDAFADLYKSSGSVFGVITNGLSENLETRNSEITAWQSIKILEVLIDAENQFLATFPGKIKRFFEKIGTFFFKTKTDLQLAEELKSAYKQIDISAISSDQKRQWEFQAEKIMASFIASKTNKTFAYIVGTNHKKTVFSEPNKELYAKDIERGEEYLTVVGPNVDVYRMNITKPLGAGGEHIVFPGAVGSFNPARHKKEVAVAVSKKDPKDIDRTTHAADLIESCKDCTGIIQQYEKPFKMQIGSYYRNKEEYGFVLKSNDEAVFHVTERCPNSVKDFLKKLADNSAAAPYSEEQIKTIKKGLITSLIKGVNELHQRGIIHRDLKPDNILLVGDPLKGDLDTKIIDFGYAVRTTNDEKEIEFRKMDVGSFRYFAPERLKDDESKLSNDIWGLGLICFQTWFDKSPMHQFLTFEGIKSIESLTQYDVDAWFSIAGQSISLAPAGDRKFIEIIKSMLQVNPEKRSTAGRLITMLNEVVVEEDDDESSGEEIRQENNVSSF